MKRSPFQYVREGYGVPAFRGARVWYYGTPGRVVHATSYVRVRFRVEDARENDLLRAYVRRGAFVTVELHPCTNGLAYDRETPSHRWPRDPRGGTVGWGYFVWATVCEGFGIKLYSPESYDPALLEPWPRDPRLAPA